MLLCCYGLNRPHRVAAALPPTYSHCIVPAMPSLHHRCTARTPHSHVAVLPPMFSLPFGPVLPNSPFPRPPHPPPPDSCVPVPFGQAKTRRELARLPTCWDPHPPARPPTVYGVECAHGHSWYLPVQPRSMEQMPVPRPATRPPRWHGTVVVGIHVHTHPHARAHTHAGMHRCGVHASRSQPPPPPIPPGLPSSKQRHTPACGHAPPPPHTHTPQAPAWSSCQHRHARSPAHCT